MTSKVKHISTSQNTNVKVTLQMVEQERNMLKITLEYIVKENESLKEQLEDMRITVKHNKEQLKEYIENITNKDKVVEKMNATNEQLASRIHSLEEHIKQNLNKNGGGNSMRPALTKSTPKNNNTPNSISNELKLGNNSSTILNPNILSSYDNISVPITKENNTNVTSVTRNTTNMTNTNMTRNNSENPATPKTFFKREPDVALPTSKSVNKKNDDRVKEFFFMQSRILEEMETLKNDLQFILENKKKSKLQETLGQSYRSMNSPLSNINLNNSVISHTSATNVNKKYNLKEKFNFDINMKKFQDFLTNYNPAKNILLFVDSKNCIWELINRTDLNINILTFQCENIVSATSGLFTNKFLPDDLDSPKSKLLNIEIKDYSLNNSELDISKLTDYNFMRDFSDI